MNTKEIEKLDPTEKLKIDYEKLVQILDDKEISQDRFSQMVGFAKGWLSVCKTRRTDIIATRALQMAAILQCDARVWQ